MERLINELQAAIPGIAGSALALAFMRRPLRTLAAIFLGGCLLSYFGGAWLAEVLSLERHVSLAGFVMGLTGMAIVAKLLDTLEALQPHSIAAELLGALRRRLGGRDRREEER